MSEEVALRSRRLSWITEDNVPLVADAWGDPQNRTVLFAHGGGQTRHAWGGAAQKFAAEGWYAVSLDLRGHGDSGWPEDGDYRLETYGRDLLQVAASLESKPAVVGASMGGISAMIAQGELAPEKQPFASVVLVDITPHMEEEGVDRILQFMGSKLEQGFADLEEVADFVASYMPNRPRPKDLSGLAKNLRQGEDGRYRWHWDPRFITGAMRPRGDQEPERLSAACAAIAVPTLLVRGRMSDLVSEENVGKFLKIVPHAEFTDVSGAGHMVAGDRNDAFVAAVMEFLNGAGRPAQ